MQIHR